jgi:hypothetical protein
LYGSETDVQIEQLTQGDIQGTNPASDRRRKRPLNTDEEFLEGGYGVLGEPIIEAIFSGLTCKDFKPHDFARAFISFFDSGIEYPFTGGPNVWAGAIAPDERDYGIIRALNDTVVRGDFISSGRLNVEICHSAAPGLKI